MPKSLLSIMNTVSDRPIPLLSESELKTGESAIVRRQRLTAMSAEIDLFDYARKIYSRGRRRYSRRAAGII